MIVTGVTAFWAGSLIGPGRARENPPAKEPPAAKSAEHGNRHRLHHCRPGNGSGVREVEHHGAGCLELLRVRHEGVRFRRGIGSFPAHLCEHGNSRLGQRAHDATGVTGRVDFHDVRATLIDQSPSRANGGVASLAQHASRNVTADERPHHAAANAPARQQHRIEGDVLFALEPPDVRPDRIADRHDIHAGAIDDLWIHVRKEPDG